MHEWRQEKPGNPMGQLAQIGNSGQQRDPVSNKKKGKDQHSEVVA